MKPEEVLDRKIDSTISYMQEIFKWSKEDILNYISKNCNLRMTA